MGPVHNGWLISYSTNCVKLMFLTQKGHKPQVANWVYTLLGKVRMFHCIRQVNSVLMILKNREKTEEIAFVILTHCLLNLLKYNHVICEIMPRQWQTSCINGKSSIGIILILWIWSFKTDAKITDRYKPIAILCLIDSSNSHPKSWTAISL